MRLSPQNLVPTCSRDLDFKLDDWNQMHFDQHFIVTLQQRKQHIELLSNRCINIYSHFTTEQLTKMANQYH